jgi:UDP-GlcNAc:undecaprenyl-phosphate/decaprenyl-phosphate GlcNAc-1-phosphate transferase
LLLPGAISFIATLIFVPVVRRLCIRWNIYDPVGPLKIHSQAIPRLGGLAITLAFAAGISLAVHLSRMHVWPFFAALALIWAAGLADDIWLLSPALRLAAQVVGGILLWCGGWRLPWLQPGLANLAAVCLLTVFFINCFNFLDGSDGLCAGVTATVAAAYLIFPGLTLSPQGSTVAWSLLAVSAGFLVFNFPPARIYLGDSGSTVLGFGVAFLAFDFYGANATNERHIALAIPLLMTALPLLDGILAVLRRLLGGGSVLHGDRRHFYDLLLGLGWSPRRVASAIYVLTAAMCTIAGLVLKCDFTRALLLGAASTSALTIAAIRLGVLRSNKRSRRQFRRMQYQDLREDFAKNSRSDL